MDRELETGTEALAAHREFLDEAVRLARRSREAGNHPFGALLVLDGKIVLRGRNSVVHDGNPLRHAEFSLLDRAHRELEPAQLARCTLYTSTEPCAMCSGATYWSGIRRIVFALSAQTLGDLSGGHFVVPCAELLQRARDRVEVIGPIEVPGAREVHDGYWKETG